LQEKNIRDIRNAGGYAMVVNEDNLEELETLIANYVRWGGK
jgi:hypothetical protein